MRESIFSRTQRSRLDKLAKCLRQFGLADRFGLGELFRREQLPTASVLESRLKKYSELIPAGLTAAFLAKSILASIAANPEPELLPIKQADLDELPKLKPGHRHASKFHGLVFRLLSAYFEEQLRNGKTEQRMFGGEKRIDIVFENDSTSGFFSDLTTKYGIPGPIPFIPFECKNYVDDPATKEYDQLAGRLNQSVGLFGAMVCRQVTDRSKMRSRCQSYLFDNQKSILVLDDDDLLALGTHYLRGNLQGLNDHLGKRYREIRFG